MACLLSCLSADGVGDVRVFQYYLLFVGKRFTYVGFTYRYSQENAT